MILRSNPFKQPLLRRPRVRVGLAPGTIEAHPESAKPQIRMMAYGPDGFEERTLQHLGEMVPFAEKWPSLWIHVEGLGDEGVIQQLGERFALHKLALEDVISRNQQPKLEPYDDHLFLVALVAVPGDQLDLGQVNIFVGQNFILTLQERKLDWHESVRKRIREGRTRIRKLGTNYLSFALLDSMVDRYFPVIEEYGDRLTSLEEEVLANPAQDEIFRIHGIRKEFLALRTAVAPLKEVTRILSREDMPPITEETRLFFRDCYDHVSHLIDTIETDREVSRGLIDLCLSTLSHKMNEVMKVLTIIATIFIPLGFIAGLYGMNFNPERSPFNMPELNWYLGYPFVLGLMALTVMGLLIYFRKKGWLGGAGRDGGSENSKRP